MTIPQHFQLAANLPVYCLDWIDNDAFVYAGGGGKGRTGVGNFIRVVHLPGHASSSADATLAAELKLSSEEDAPMAIAVDALRTKTIVLGINEADEQKSQGNEHLRLFAFEKDGKNVTLKPTSAATSLPLTDPAEGYVRRLALSPDRRQLISASTEGAYALHEYPSLDPSFRPTTDFQGDEIVDADFSSDGTQLVICTGRKLKILGTFPNPAEPSSSTSTDPISKTEAALQSNADAGVGPKSSLADVAGTKIVSGNSQLLAPPPIWQTIQNPALGGEGGCEFRAVRFGKARQSRSSLSVDGEKKLSDAEKVKKDAEIVEDVKAAEDSGEKTKDDSKSVPSTSSANSSGSEGKLFTVVNAKSSGKGKASKRKSFLTAWSLSSWELIETRQLSEKPVTVFSLSPCGRYLAYGCSDLSIGVLNSRTLRPVLRILDAHSFPPTALAFSPNGQWLVSASADNTLRVIKMPATADDVIELGSSSVGLAMVSLAERKWLLTLLLTVFILVLALYIQRYVLPTP